MSADLFAEFNQPPKQTATQSQPPAPAYQSSANAPLQAKDPFDFGYGSSTAQASPAPQQWSSFSPQPASAAFSMQPPVSAPMPTQSADDDDGWGDFEVADPAQQSQPAQPIQPVQSVQSQSIAWPSSAAAAPAQKIAWPSSAAPAAPQITHGTQFSQSNITSNAFSNTAQNTLQEIDDAWSQPKAKRKNTVQSQAADPGVLFDAGDFELEDGEFEGESDDEFGDFETVKPAAPQPKKPVAPTPAPVRAPAPRAPQASMPSMDLLSLDEPMAAPPQTSQQIPSSGSGPLRFGASSPVKSEAKRSSMQDWDFDSFETKKAPAAKTQRATQTKPKHKPTASKSSTTWATAAVDDEWAAWDDAPSTTAIDSTPAPASWDWDTSDNTATASAPPASASDSSPPPINVPPPSVLLSLFPELLNTGSALFKATSGKTGSIKDQILADPKAVQFLQGYILLATTAARVIAGRKHRWHRDKILAKSMSISAAGSKGMKLAGVDKTQAAREDREAADVVAVWREHVGRLRSAVTAANTGAKANLKVPELSETLSAHTAKLVARAPKPCVICGLKRDERITKVDHDVEDSFGEWWVEHWGHRACKNFWIEHEKSLRQR